MHTQLPPNRLKVLREEKSLTLMDVATECGVYPTTVYRWERGEIPQKQLMGLARLLGTDPAYLAGLADEDRQAA